MGISFTFSGSVGVGYLETVMEEELQMSTNKL